MKPARRVLVCLVCLMPVVAACQPPPKTYPMVSQPLTIQEEASPDLTFTTYQAADILSLQLRDYAGYTWVLVSTTFVNTDNLEQSSPLGRLLSRQVASRLSQNGMSMVESRLRNTMSINKSGEFILSRDLRLLEKEHRARGVLVGHYTVADKQIYVTTQVVRIKDQVVLATADFTLPVTGATRTLLGIPRGVPMQDALTRGKGE